MDLQTSKERRRSFRSFQEGVREIVCDEKKRREERNEQEAEREKGKKID
ncbi:Protein CBG25208 [Caenorhabditis briggsae]|uniref:Protein CBG25208 n=1 Tax=Caenorhabditis briggsae TaxID=6238 RepID=B6IJG6_CAEBR|nr:Protein CBG25208 [Caenorhabditis briggsae]CAS00046.1 Protein CBG25208 [Caenorhabditis briggsae]